MLHKFKQNISEINLPGKFTFPFYYTPHKLVEIATTELQEYLLSQNDFEYNFGIRNDHKGTAQGKMFGVLVVKKGEELFHIWAFSGKLGNLDTPKYFVAPVFDIYNKNSFYPSGEKEIDKITAEINLLENNPYFNQLKNDLSDLISENEAILFAEKESMRIAKAVRKKRRIEAEKELNENDFLSFKNILAKESIARQNNYKIIKDTLDKKQTLLKNEYDDLSIKIERLKEKRKQMSSALQRRIFESYRFLNVNNEIKNLTDIFPLFEDNKPPAGSGDCSAPKLLQYAFLNNLEPVAMGEFWWGISPKDEIRQHKVFYPSCNSRCRPILAHMLDGIEMDDNILVKQPDRKKELHIAYEDDWIIIVNKPHEFLSVPGKNVTDSVYSRMLDYVGNDKGPLLVHRLDMSTSGILIIAKDKESHKFLQEQFINRTVTKRYVALINGIPKENSGLIDLPIRVDLEDRPRQLVCYEYGKKAITKWEIVNKYDGYCMVYLYPLTGRTHQLRVHMAHSKGLECPIIGDDLYGEKAERLFLHAEQIKFIHPSSKDEFEFSLASNFNQMII